LQLSAGGLRPWFGGPLGAKAVGLVGFPLVNPVKKSYNFLLTPRKRDSGQGIEDPFGNVIAKNFAIFYAEVAKPEKLAREFKEITVVALELSYSASELGCHKNRYADIYPCESV